MTKDTHRRKNYVVKKKFQANFLLKFVGLLILEAVLIYTLFMYTSRGSLTAAYRGADFTIRTTQNFFLTDFFVIFLLVGAANGIIGLFVFMFLSHRVGGALYRFEKTLEGAKEGDFAQRVKLRKTDELHDLNFQMNLFLEAMDRRMTDLKREVNEGLVSIEQGKQDPGKAKEALQGIRASLKRFKTSE